MITTLGRYIATSNPVNIILYVRLEAYSEILLLKAILKVHRERIITSNVGIVSSRLLFFARYTFTNANLTLSEHFRTK